MVTQVYQLVSSFGAGIFISERRVIKCRKMGHLSTNQYLGVAIKGTVSDVGSSDTVADTLRDQYVSTVRKVR